MNLDFSSQLLFGPKLKKKGSIQQKYDDDKPIKESTGTSIIACKFKGGIVIGADTRTSYGTFISNRGSDKLTKVHDRIYCCRSGSSADTQAISDYVRYYLEIHGTEYGTYPLVNTAAKLFQKFCYDYKDQLSASIIVGGWDEIKGGVIYQIPLGGTLLEMPFALGGSGSTYVYGYCDAHYKDNFTEEECKKFVKDSLSLAIGRDGSSGGFIRIATITKDGVKRETIQNKDLSKFNIN